jgi:hypothetical protein
MQITHMYTSLSRIHLRFYIRTQEHLGFTLYKIKNKNTRLHQHKNLGVEYEATAPVTAPPPRHKCHRTWARAPPHPRPRHLTASRHHQPQASWRRSPRLEAESTAREVGPAASTPPGN